MERGTWHSQNAMGQPLTGQEHLDQPGVGTKSRVPLPVGFATRLLFSPIFLVYCGCERRFSPPCQVHSRTLIPALNFEIHRVRKPSHASAMVWNEAVGGKASDSSSKVR